MQIVLSLHNWSVSLVPSLSAFDIVPRRKRLKRLAGEHPFMQGGAKGWFYAGSILPKAKRSPNRLTWAKRQLSLEHFLPLSCKSRSNFQHQTWNVTSWVDRRWIAMLMLWLLIERGADADHQRLVTALFNFRALTNTNSSALHRGSLNPMREAHPAWLATVCSCTSVSEESMQCFLYSEPDFFQSADFGEPDCASPVLLDCWRCFQAIEPVFIVQVLTQLRSKSTGTFASGSVERGKSSCWDYGTDDGSHNILQCGLPACAPNVINVQIFHCWVWRLEDQANKTTVTQKSFKHVTEILRTCGWIVTKRVKMDLRVGQGEPVTICHDNTEPYWTINHHKSVELGDRPAQRLCFSLEASHSFHMFSWYSCIDKESLATPTHSTYRADPVNGKPCKFQLGVLRPEDGRPTLNRVIVQVCSRSQGGIFGQRCFVLVATQTCMGVVIYFLMFSPFCPNLPKPCKKLEDPWSLEL